MLQVSARVQPEVNARGSVPATSYPSASVAIYALSVFFLAALVSYTDRLILNLLVDSIRRDLMLTDAQISYLQGAAFAIVYGAIGLPLGRYADRHNRRNMIVCGVGFWTLATAACGFAGGFSQLFLARMCVGIGEAALAPAVMSMIPDFFPPARRGTAIGLFIAGQIMGGGAANVLGGALIGLFAGGGSAAIPLLGHLTPWRAVLVSLSLPGVLVAILLARVAEPRRQETLGTMVSSSAKERYRILGGYFLDNRFTFILLFGALALDNVRGYGTDAWMPSLLIRKFELSGARTGTLLGLTLLVSAGVGAVVGGVAADWLQRKGRPDAALRLALGAIVGEALLSAFPLLPDVTAVITGYGAYTLVAAMVATAGITAAQNAIPSEMRGIGTAVQASLFTLIGLSLGPTLVAWTTQFVYHDSKLVGLSILTVALPTLVAMAALLWCSLPHYRRTRKHMLAEKPD